MKKTNEKKVICPYCKRELNRINTQHLKTHNITWIEYLKEYDKEKYDEERLCEFIEDYYQPAKRRFIEQVGSWNGKQKKEGNYSWITIKTTSKNYLAKKIEEIKNDESQTAESIDRTITQLKKSRPFPFCKADIKAHVRQKRTVGIYTADEKKNCFLTFDIDVDDTEIVEKIWETLNIFGIKDEQILASWSGNKGYHISVFFKELINKIDIQKFFNIIIREANLECFKRDNDADVVECRGASFQGVKLPLSLNKKNAAKYIKVKTYDDYKEQQELGRGNFCYLINKYGGEIDTLSKIESMEKVDINLINTIIEDYHEELTFENEIEELEDEFKGVIEDVDIDEIANNKEDIMASAKSLLTKPIKPRMRHKTLLIIAIYNKTRGFTCVENEEFLIDFSYARKDQFKTSLKENNEEIKRMLNTIYNSPSAFKYKMAATPKDIYFSKEDICEILSLRNKALQKMYFLIMLHFKMYADFSGKEFYLGYDRIRRALKVNEGVIAKRLIKLQELGKIEFIRKGEWDDPFKEGGKMKRHKKPNIYELNYDIQYVESGFKLLCNAKNSGENITYVNFQMMCGKALTKQEIKEFCKDWKEIKKFKNGRLQEVS